MKRREIHDFRSRSPPGYILGMRVIPHLRVERNEPRPLIRPRKDVRGMNSFSPRQSGQASARFSKRPAGIFFAVMLASFPLCSQKTAYVEINFKTELAQVPAAGYGVGMSVYDSDFTSPGLPARLKAAGVNALRYPGGSYSDAYHWRTHSRTAGTNIWINANDTFDHFMTMDVIPSGAQAIITVNYGSNQAGTGGGDPAEAADWVRYANREKGWNIRYWEIGNEVGGNGYFGTEWEEDLHAPLGHDRKGNPALSQTAYGKNALEFIRAMKAVDPSIKIGVGVDMPDSHPGTGNEALFKAVKDQIDYVIVHWYPKASATDLTVTEDIKPQAAALRDEIARYAGSALMNIPIAITETNGGGDGATRALFATDAYLTWFEAGAFTVEWQEMHNDFLAEDVKEVPLDTPSGEYYGMQMASTAARPGDALVAAQSSTPMIAAHAVRRKDGGVAIVLINKHPTQPYLVNVALSGAPVAASGTRYDFGRANFSNSLWPASGPTESHIEGSGSSFSVTVPASSESVLLIAGK